MHNSISMRQNFKDFTRQDKRKNLPIKQKKKGKKK